MPRAGMSGTCKTGAGFRGLDRGRVQGTDRGRVQGLRSEDVGFGALTARRWRESSRWRRCRAGSAHPRGSPAPVCRSDLVQCSAFRVLRCRGWGFAFLLSVYKLEV